MLNAIITWLGNSWLHDFMVQNTAAFIVAETLHFIGLTILIGTLMVIDLRGLGLLKRLPMLVLHKLVPVALVGFAINLLTGLSFMAYGPTNYIGNSAFEGKMALILLAGVNALVFEFMVFRPMAAGVPGVEHRVVTKLTSGLSLAIWAGVLVFGRLIPYV